MTAEPIDILGGESVYCINETQLKAALELADKNPESSAKIQKYLLDTERELTRNERAALAFVLIDRLLKAPGR